MYFYSIILPVQKIYSIKVNNYYFTFALFHEHQHYKMSHIMCFLWPSNIYNTQNFISSHTFPRAFFFYFTQVRNFERSLIYPKLSISWLNLTFLISIRQHGVFTICRIRSYWNSVWKAVYLIPLSRNSLTRKMTFRN